MPEVELANLLPTMKDLIAPAIIGAALWIAKKVLPVVSGKLHKALKSWVISDLRKIKSIRRCPFAIQRQIAKEGALFNAFLAITVVMLGVLILLSRQLPIKEQLTFFSICMTPVLVLEWWWLIARDFSEQLLQESSRIGPGFKRVTSHREQSDRRLQARKQRQAAIAKRKSVKKAEVRVVARRLA
jgi:hypothetical protein